MAIEVAYDRKYKKGFYRFNDAVNNLSMGIIQQVCGLFLNIILLIVFVGILNHYSIQQLFGAPAIPETWWTYILAFFLVDFLYYWYHRKSHEMNFLWASHIVHHQSEEYNLAVALRQGTFQVFFTFFFFLPMPFLGFSVQLFLTTYLIGVVYQFWIHTRTIGKLPFWFEFIFNTPSHHRVHHGKNIKYLDKNHGAVFIIWDRIFGSFQEEEEEPVYGITTGMKSWNPVWLNFTAYIQLFKNSWKTKHWRDKIRVFYKPPGWRPADLGPKLKPKAVSRETQEKYDPVYPTSVGWYIFVQLLPLLLGFQWIKDFGEQQATFFQMGIIVFFYVLSLTNFGGLFDQRKWAWWSETSRIMTLGICGSWILYSLSLPLFWIVGLALFVVVSLQWILQFRK